MNVDADYPHLSAIENLECQLNLMDKRIGVKSAYHGFPRWSVGEDKQGLFINRNMIGLHEKDVKEYVPTRDMTRLLNLTHFDTPCPSWDVMKEAKELDQFFEFTSGMPVISYLRAFCTMRYTRAIYIVAGHEGPDPGDPNGGYVAKINLPGRFYKIEDVNMQIFRDVDSVYTLTSKKNKQKHDAMETHKEDVSEDCGEDCNGNSENCDVTKEDCGVTKERGNEVGNNLFKDVWSVNLEDRRKDNMDKSAKNDDNNVFSYAKMVNNDTNALDKSLNCNGEEAVIFDE
ncbi:hypothetical protein Tco_0745472 [Tanacetum coccineum]